ncbi:LacI family DNA-binding transcriptional regulator [Microbacterium mangrovi]|uniref:LacI family DNA-binding transcriptional regulator n=1 Tax=Microbacterium mangrovi TaxID=1348253 RepID=UPI00068C61E8|nr:LacI family DNA-binding transcriptional regulator [Microbacterium mangrovi]
MSTTSPTEGRRPSMADVATAAGVSVTTVSRALSGKGDLPTETRVRIQETARALGYTRWTTTRGRPDTTDARMIELVLGTYDDAFTNEVSVGARQAAARMGYDLLQTLERDDPEDDWPARVARRHPAGVILGLIQPTHNQLARLNGLNIPIVLLEPASDPHNELQSVSTTNWQGGYDAGMHLVGLGLTHFICVAGEPKLRFGRARESGFSRAVFEHVPGSVFNVVKSDWTTRPLTEELAPLVRGRGPVGVFTCNDNMAVGVYTAAKRLGLSIPDDLCVIGFDDTARSAHMEPPLTTVHQPIRALAARAVEMIEQLRAGHESRGDRIELPTRLVVRGSTLPLEEPPAAETDAQ